MINQALSPTRTALRRIAENTTPAIADGVSLCVPSVAESLRLLKTGWPVLIAGTVVVGDVKS